MSNEADLEGHRYELRIDGQKAGNFAAVNGLDTEPGRGVRSLPLRRALTVILRDGYLLSDYGDWLAHGRSQVGHHGEIVGLAASGDLTSWLFVEGWPTETTGQQIISSGRIELRSLVLEIEDVRSRTVKLLSASVTGEPVRGLASWTDLWRRFFRRRP